ncbi:hypothetical protein [Hyphomicrobium sp.]|uniref:hypothetical protein n=1 Tax=Hyphomicrobium sp. TaxID=82 RepID=UPI000FA37BA4|nr:hypothetical protein [Hyphomicrobium sp.]RUP07837.1 MAG: hypothetical protein EKK38_16940 [Hyphomicrobium sp.]
MTLRPSLPWLLFTLTAALIAMYLAASAVLKVEAAIAAAVFALVIIVSAIRTNAPVWRQPPAATGPTPREALFRTIQLMMLSYLWCAIAFYAIYLGTHTRWQHGWEYGTAILLISGAYGYYLRRLRDPADNLSSPPAIDRMVRFTAYLALLIGAGLIWLIGSGKLATVKGDWAANQLFLAGGFAVMCLSAIIVKTNSVLAERHAN